MGALMSVGVHAYRLLWHGRQERQDRFENAAICEVSGPPRLTLVWLARRFPAMTYEPPGITDHGDLAELTAGCIGTNAPDLMNPADPEGFPDNSPGFGDPSFCEP